jgi:hypothetical protein
MHDYTIKVSIQGQTYTMKQAYVKKSELLRSLLEGTPFPSKISLENYMMGVDMTEALVLDVPKR